MATLHDDGDARNWGGPEVALLLASIAVGALDFMLLGIAVAFGPTGFGGDGPVTSRQLALAHAEQAAGWTGGVLSVVVLVIVLALKVTLTRRRALGVVFAVQWAATVGLVAMLSS